MVGALCINFAEGHRTSASVAVEREGRRHLDWYFTRRFYSLDEFDSAGRRAFRLGRILVVAAGVAFVSMSVFWHH